MSQNTNNLINLTSNIVSAHVAHNTVGTADVGPLIESVHAALSQAASPPLPIMEKQEPAVPIRSSVKPAYIVCLEDGKKVKLLKRYLRTNFDMSPAEYREKWGLPASYPMAAPDYSSARKELATKIGLGRKFDQAAGSSEGVQEAPPPPSRDIARELLEAANLEPPK